MFMTVFRRFNGLKRLAWVYARVVLCAVITLFIWGGQGLQQSCQAEPVQPGHKIPAFTLTAHSGKPVSLVDYAGKNLIVVFYPKDQTAGCTIQLCALRDAYGRLKALNTEVVGINPAGVASHRRFVNEQKYPFLLLSDPKRTVSDLFGVDRLLGFNQRTVFILDTQGVVRYSKKGLPPVSELIHTIEAFSDR